MNLPSTPAAPTGTVRPLTVTQQRMAAIFNEWMERYARHPEQFGDILDSDGKLVTDYGERCARFFCLVAKEMDKEGRLPVTEEARLARIDDHEHLRNRAELAVRVLNSQTVGSAIGDLCRTAIADYLR